MAKAAKSNSTTKNFPLARRYAKQSGMSQEDYELILTVVPDDAIDSEVAQFLYQINRTGLDPISRQIYLVPRWNKAAGRNVCQVQTGIDGYRLVAERTGKYAGNSDAVFNGSMTQYEHKLTGEENPVTATITIKKALDNGSVGEFVATSEWDSYYPGDRQGFMWKKMSYVMLSKVAEALALRKAFPNELSGVYTAEEMAQASGRPEEDVSAEIMEVLDVVNPKALDVMSKFDDIDIQYDDADVVSVLGCPLNKVSNDEAGVKKLFAAWEFAVSVKKGTELSVAIEAMKNKLSE